MHEYPDWCVCCPYRLHLCREFPSIRRKGTAISFPLFFPLFPRSEHISSDMCDIPELFFHRHRYMWSHYKISAARNNSAAPQETIASLPNRWSKGQMKNVGLQKSKHQTLLRQVAAIRWMYLFVVWIKLLPYSLEVETQGFNYGALYSMFSRKPKVLW